jgi:hypothetical protein
MASMTGYTLANGQDLSQVFMNISDSASSSSQNIIQSTQKFANDIDLSGSLMFYSMPSTIVSVKPYPIGYTIDISSASIPVTANDTSLNISNPDTGVWLVTASLVLTKGSATSDTAARFRIDLSCNNTNIVYSPPNPLIRLPVELTNSTNPTVQMGLTAVAVVKSSDTTLKCNSGVAIIAPGTASYKLYLEITKIA